MVTQRRYGPKDGDGVAIIDKSIGGSIQSSRLGTAAYTCILERGVVGPNGYIECAGLADLKRKTGGLIPEGYGPDCAQAYWAMSEGAGRQLFYRVTDGNERVATLNLYGRMLPRQLVGRLDAHNGGGWGGRRQRRSFDVAAYATDIAETFVMAPIAETLLKDELKGGTLTIPGSLSGNGATYKITGNDASDGAAKTKISFDSNVTADTDFGAATDPECLVDVPSENGWGQLRYLAAEILDGIANPSTEWGLRITIVGQDGEERVLSYPDLSSDPTKDNFWVDVINEDPENHFIKATNLWAGAISADIRPANFYGQVTSSTDVTATVIQLKDKILLVDSSAAGLNTIGSFTFGAEAIGDRFEIEYNAAGTDWTVKSLDHQANHAFPNATGGVAYTADNKYSIGFTVTENTPSNGQKFTVTVLPLEIDEVIGGRVFLDGVAGAAAQGYPITDNTINTITAANSDLTVGATLPATVEIRLQYKQQFSNGYDGIATLADSHFTAAYDVNTSPFNDTKDEGHGLIKFATPGITKQSGVTAATVEKAGIAYAAAKNHQYREEIPSTVTSELSARDYVHTTIGRNQRSAVDWPSWGNVTDPIRRGRKKLIPLTGDIHGIEARYARDNDGYHVVAAGTNAWMHRIIDLPTGDVKPDREILNPAGITSILKKNGRWVRWGATIPTDDPNFRQKHQRELHSHHAHTLQEALDFGVFSTSDPVEAIVTALTGYFQKELDKGALEGDTIDEAVKFNYGPDINTAATRAAGDTNVEVEPLYPFATERVNLTLAKGQVSEG